MKALSIWEAYPFAPQQTVVQGQKCPSCPANKMAFSCLTANVERAKAAGSRIPIEMLFHSSALKWSQGLQSLTSEMFQAVLATAITSKKQYLSVPHLWLPQVVLLHHNDLEYSGCFIPLVRMNQDTLPHLQSWKECAQDCSYDCTETLHRAVKVKPIVIVHFPLP